MASTCPSSAESAVRHALDERAGSLLCLIESRTISLVAQSRRALEIFLTRVAGQRLGVERSAEARAAILSIQDLERCAAHWRPLVPPDVELRAVLAHRLGERYAVADSTIPNLRLALGVDEDGVQAAYRRRYGTPIQAIYGRRSDSADGTGVMSCDPAPARQSARSALDDLIDEAEWQTVSGGEMLWRQGDPADCMSIVVSGRLQAVVNDGRGNTRPVAELGRGDSVGEMGLLADEPRSATVYATRDSTLLELPKAAFERVVARHPRVLLQLSRELTARLRRTNAGQLSEGGSLVLTLLAADRGVRLSELAARLATALAADGSTFHLNGARLDAHLGPGSTAALDLDPADGRTMAWLDDQEAAHRVLVYEADPTPSAWTRLCLRRADRILLVGRANADPTPGPIEQELLDLQDRPVPTRTELVLLHDGGQRVDGTGRWLARRRLDGHHHVDPGSRQDVERLARLLTGRGTGLVLGGGGARGFVHIGVIRALREHGIPIDLIGGTSIGAAIAAQYALGWDDQMMLDLNRRGWINARPMWDYTVPIVALLSGGRVAKVMEMMFEDARIEDLRTGYFCVSSDLTHGQARIHQSGLLRKYVRASMSVPGMVPPVSDDGALLVDGGILNNLPADVMRGHCPRGTVIAVDVNPRTGPRASADYGDTLSAWKLIAGRLNPRGGALQVPSVHEILERVTMLGSVQQAAALADTTVDLYLHPPTDAFQMFELASLDKIADVGYAYARPLVGAWQARQARPATGQADGR
jgi:predicted acylesterase/phospholipase RssA/CRP-like cAMP-binding protein